MPGPYLAYPTHDTMLAFWRGATPVVGLLTQQPSPDGTNVAEPPGSYGYSRQAVTLGDFTRDGSGISSTKNTNPMVFGPPINANWPSVSWVALFAQDGRMLAYAPLPAPRACNIGDSISFGVGAFQFRFR